MPRSPYPRVLAVASALAAAVALLVVMPSAHAAPAGPTVTLTITELPAQVRLIPGEAVKVRLTTNRTTGYTWSTKVVGQKASVKVGKGAYAAPVTDVVGAPGTTTWLVTATSRGRAQVRFLTSPPGEDTRSLVGTLTVIVQ